MFQSLSEKLENAFRKFRNKGKLTESDIKAGMREIKLALLEADVNFKVVKDFAHIRYALSSGLVLTSKAHKTSDTHVLPLETLPSSRFILLSLLFCHNQSFKSASVGV